MSEQNFKNFSKCQKIEIVKMSVNCTPKYRILRKIFGTILTENALLNRTRCFRCAIQVLKILGFKLFWYIDIEGIF